MTTPYDMVMKIAKERDLEGDDFHQMMEEIAKMNLDGSAMPVPKIIDQMESDGILTFTLEHCDVSWVNALRRILLTNVPSCCIRTENESVNQCHVMKNTSRLHNEMLKHRLSCIPIHTIDLQLLPGIFELVLDITNDTDHVLLVTSQHFRIRRKDDPNVFLSDDDTRSLFPPSPLTGDFIEFARLRPVLGDVPPEHIFLIADFSVATPFDNSMFNQVSTCTYSATIDQQALQHATLNGFPPPLDHDMLFKKRNFLALDAQRFTIHNSWLFTIQTLGPYTNSQLLHFAITHLQQAFFAFYTLHSTHALPPTLHTHLLDLSIHLPFDLSFAQSFTHTVQSLFVPHTLSFFSFLQTHPLLPHITLRSSNHSHFTHIILFSSLYALHLCGGLSPPSYTPPSKTK